MKGVFVMSLFDNLLIFTSTGTGTGDSGSSSSGSTEKITEFLKNMVKSPWFYIVIGAIVLLIIAVYLLRRIVKPAGNTVKVVVRGGKIYKLIDENSPKYFMVPFKDSLGAVVGLDEKEFSSDKLYINNGPDALYKINYTLKYKVTGIEKFFEHRDSYQNEIITKINDSLREYADEGHALEIVKDYRKCSDKLVELLNKVTEDYGVTVSEFKINFIEPFGKK